MIEDEKIDETRENKNAARHQAAIKRRFCATGKL